MDNITHTLAGLLVGESISRLAPGARSALEPARRRRLLLGLSVAASNLPDADVLYTVAAGKLAYLSQHRGYTHTLAGVLAAAILLLVFVELWMRRGRVRLTRADQQSILLAVAVSLLLHLALDFTNNYGVHPFWPVDDRWFYGDAVFIIEPLLWSCAAPLVFLLRGALARGVIGVVLIAALWLSFGTKWIAPASGIALATLMLALLSTGWRARPAVALACAMVAWLGVTTIFFAESHAAAQSLRREFAVRWPGEQLVDQVLTPLPANPLCWDAIAVSLPPGGYALRRAIVATAPGWLPVAACPDQTVAGSTTAPMRPIAAPRSEAIRWIDEYRTSRAEFARTVASSCAAAVQMRFARAPWVAATGGDTVIGDLRYDRDPGLEFAEIELRRQPHRCAPIPPWLPPRRELMPPPAR